MVRFADDVLSDRQGPLRVLQVVGVMNRAGIETWLMHVLRAIDRDRFAIDFVVEGLNQGDYDEEIADLGARVLPVGSRKSLRYGSRFRRAIWRNGPYDVVHSHLNFYNGYVMRLARRSGVATRISHSHTDTTAKEQRAGWKRRLGVGLMRDWIARYSTFGLAASEPAAISMFGSQWRKRDRFRVMHCGLDLAPFGRQYDRADARREFGLPADAWVIGHVGRMVDEKNHRLIIDTFAEILPHADNAYLLLVGDGPLRQDIECQARQAGVIDRVRFAGNRNDVPRILCAAVDTFAFPSKFEGLGIALIEAQAAGLPCVISDVIPDEADVLPELITRLSIEQSWAAALLSTRDHDRQQEQSYAQVLRTDFSISRGVAELQRLYQATEAATPLTCIEAIQ